MPTENDIICIQRNYLEILDTHFPKLWEEYIKSGLSPIQFLSETPPSKYSSEMTIVHSGKQWSAIAFEADKLLIEISSFWDSNQLSLQNALNSSNRLNTQIGDLNGMSWYYLTATIRLGLYFDSICIIDPFSIMAQRRKTMDQYLTGNFNDPQLIYLLLNYLHVRSLTPLLLSETDLPIAILVPPTGIVWGDNIHKRLEGIAQENTYRLFASVFNQKVGGIEDFVSIFENNSLQQIENIFRGNDILKTLLDGSGSLNGFIKASSFETDSLSKEFSQIPPRFQNMIHVKGAVEGVFLALEGAETSASNLGIDICIPKELWGMNRFRYKCKSELISSFGLRAEVPIQAAIMSEKMNWLSTATISDLVKLREKGFMEQIREIYRVNRRDLQRSSPENIDITTSMVVKNVTEALQQCKDEAERLKNDPSHSWFKKIILFLIPGSLGIGSLFIPPISWFSTAYTLLVPGASSTDLILKYRNDQRNQNEFMNRPIMHMLEIWDRSTKTESNFNVK